MQISLTKFGCKILMTTGGMEGLATHLHPKMAGHSSCLLMTDSKINELYGEKLKKILEGQAMPIHQIVFPEGEQTKNLETARHCWEEMHRLGLDRKSLIIALGGGVVTDIAGFVASCYMRGIDVIHIPTTLLGMVDAAIGGKRG